MWRLRVLIFMMQFCVSKTLLHIIFFPQDFCLSHSWKVYQTKIIWGACICFATVLKTRLLVHETYSPSSQNQLGWAWLSHTLELNNFEVHEITTKSSKKMNILFHESKILRLVFHLLMINFHCIRHSYIYIFHSIGWIISLIFCCLDLPKNVVLIFFYLP